MAATQAFDFDDLVDSNAIDAGQVRIVMGAKYLEWGASSLDSCIAL